MVIGTAVFMMMVCGIAWLTSGPQRTINRRMSRRIRASRKTLFGKL